MRAQLFSNLGMRICLIAVSLSLQISICSSLEPGKVRVGKVNELFVYDNFSRAAVDEVQAGDICALTGIQDISVSGGSSLGHSC